MYVLKCVKPGYFNCDRSAGTGHFVGNGGDSTKSLNMATQFQTKSDASRYRERIQHTDEDRLSDDRAPDAIFEIAPIVIALK